jgi:hypothetical protein
MAKVYFLRVFLVSSFGLHQGGLLRRRILLGVTSNEADFLTFK